MSRVNYTIIAVRLDGSHDVHCNLDDRAALERRHDALLKAGYTECSIMVIETHVEDNRQITDVLTHFKKINCMVKTHKALGV